MGEENNTTKKQPFFLTKDKKIYLEGSKYFQGSDTDKAITEESVKKVIENKLSKF